MDKKQIIIFVSVVLFLVAGLITWQLINRENRVPELRPGDETISTSTDSAIIGISSSTLGSAQALEEISQYSAQAGGNITPSEQDMVNALVLYYPNLADDDMDGLTNEAEKAAGTDPNKLDSDSDALSDSSEIEAYFTDPKKADSDGDGFRDGDEVKKGFNPKGEGKLR